MAVVITDGKQTTTGQYTRLAVASRGIKRKGVTVFAVGIGSSVDQSELEEIASERLNVFMSASFNDLHDLSPEITTSLCEGKGLRRSALSCFWYFKGLLNGGKKNSWFEIIIIICLFCRRTVINAESDSNGNTRSDPGSDNAR